MKYSVDSVFFKAAVALILINLGAAIYGIYYYDTLLAKTDPPLWVFALDSPLHAFLFAAAIGLALVKKANNWITHLAAIGCIKYGLWTIFVVLFQSEYFLAPSVAPQYIFLFVAHIGQIIQGLFLVGTKRMGIAMLLILGGWTLLNDYMDYGIGTHPMIAEKGLETVAAGTVLISLVSIAVVFYGAEKRINLFKPFPFLGGLRAHLFD